VLPTLSVACVLRTKPFPESTVRSVTHQVLHGLAFMHDHGEWMLTESGYVYIFGSDQWVKGAFSALTLLVGRQEEHPVCTN